MDELKLSLTSKFMRGIVTKMLSGVIRKQFGYDVDIHLNEIRITTNEGKIHLHADVDAEMKNDEFVKVIKTIGLD